jgi:hypothetical protein
LGCASISKTPIGLHARPANLGLDHLSLSLQCCGRYGLGAQPAQLGAFVYTDQSRGDGEGVYFRLVPGTATPKVCARAAAHSAHLCFKDSAETRPALAMTARTIANWRQVSITVSFPDGKPPLPVELPTEATVAELMCLVAVKRHVAKHLMMLTRSGKPLELSSTLQACGFEDGVRGYRVAAVYRESGHLQTTLSPHKVRSTVP